MISELDGTPLDSPDGFDQQMHDAWANLDTDAANPSRTIGLTARSWGTDAAPACLRHSRALRARAGMRRGAGGAGSQVETVASAELAASLRWRHLTTLNEALCRVVVAAVPCVGRDGARGHAGGYNSQRGTHQTTWLRRIQVSERGTRGMYSACL